MATKNYFKSRGEHMHTKREIIEITPEERNVLKIKSKEAMGVIVQYLGEEKDNTQEELNKYNANDFKLENLIAIGATGQLTLQQLSRPMLIMDENLTDKIWEQMTKEEMEKYIKSQQEKQTNQTNKETTEE